LSIITYTLHRPIPIPDEPTLTSSDVTVIVPSVLDENGLEEALCSILATDPFEIILVTIDAKIELARSIAKSMMTNKIRVLSVAQPNKRRQMVRAIPEVETSVTIFADDDVIWPETLLSYMLAPLEKKEYGGVGTNQRVRRAENATFSQRAWGFLNCVYLLRRNWDCASCNFIDGGLPCLSGRTVAYRTEIINEDAFIEGFTDEVWGWQRNYKLNTDDDNFLTRWLVSRGWKIAFQNARDAEVLTDLEDNSKYLLQCVRWARSNWRSNITSMFVEGHVWWYVLHLAHDMRPKCISAKFSRLQPWSAYSVFLTTLTHLAIAWDSGLLYFCPRETWAYVLLGSLWGLTKACKLMPHFSRFPADILWLPLSIAFGYFHGGIKVYAAWTINEVSRIRLSHDCDDGADIPHRRRGVLARAQTPTTQTACNTSHDRSGSTCRQALFTCTPRKHWRRHCRHGQGP